MSQPFEGAASEVSDSAYGAAWFAFYRMPIDLLKYFADHHPAERVKVLAEHVFNQRKDRDAHEHD